MLIHQIYYLRDDRDGTVSKQRWKQRLVFFLKIKCCYITQYIEEQKFLLFKIVLQMLVTSGQGGSLTSVQRADATLKMCNMVNLEALSLYLVLFADSFNQFILCDFNNLSQFWSPSRPLHILLLLHRSLFPVSSVMWQYILALLMVLEAVSKFIVMAWILDNPMFKPYPRLLQLWPGAP